MRILSLITARGGSKRLPGKNLRILGGKPLIAWSIDAAKDIPEICDILVSTDELAIAKVSESLGAYVPWLRPSELALDQVSSVDVALHALNWYEANKGSVDGILLLQPTSPFRTKETIRRGINLFSSSHYQPILGVSLTQTHPMWMLKMNGDYLVPFIQDHSLELRSQDLPPIYSINGSFYLITPADLRLFHSFIGLKTVPLIIESFQESIDIDTEIDFKLAEFFLANFDES